MEGDNGQPSKTPRKPRLVGGNLKKSIKKRHKKLLKQRRRKADHPQKTEIRGKGGGCGGEKSFLTTRRKRYLQ